MPADHGLRPDDLQSVQHAGRQPIQPGKYQTVDAGEGQSLRRFTPQHVELMTKRQDLYLQRRSRSEQSDQRQPNQAKSISHEPRGSPDSTALTSWIEFPTRTVTGGLIGEAGAKAMIDQAPTTTPGSLHNIQRARILVVYAETAGNISETARRLGVSRNTIYRALGQKKPS